MIRCEPTEHDNGDPVRVTFAVPEDGMNGLALAVVGDFNDWDPSATPLRPEGPLRLATIIVPAGRRYAFRYLAEGGQWFNDEDADDYEHNGHGGDDSILDLTGAN